MELEEHIYLMLFGRALSARNVVRGTHMRIRSPELSSFVEYLQSKKSLVSLHIHALRSFIDACTHTHISVLTLSAHLSLSMVPSLNRHVSAAKRYLSISVCITSLSEWGSVVQVRHEHEQGNEQGKRRDIRQDGDDDTRAKELLTCICVCVHM